MTDANKLHWRRPTSAYVSRRSMMLMAGGAFAGLYIPGCKTPNQSALKDLNDASGGFDLASRSPIDRTIGATAKRQFSGDKPDRTHRILWDKAGYIASKGGTLPEPTERAAVVVVGGGMSGLMTSYLLRDHQPIVLERGDRFGGNARGESWNGLDYSIGAAYFMEPSADSPIAKLFKDLGIIEGFYRVKTVEDPVVLSQKRYPDFWHGQSDEGQKAQFVKLHKYFRDTFDNKDGLFFPDIPITDESLAERTKKLDRETFREHLERIAGGKLHPHIETTLEHFCWSSFGASFTEVSAAAGLNFYAGEFGNLLVTPGGNSAVAEHVLKALTKHIPTSNLRPSSVVFDVRVDDQGAVVTYEDEAGNLKAIRAAAVVMACPKFAVTRMLHDIEQERLDAIKRLRYHSYLVANVMLNKSVKDDFYDLFLIGEGKVDKNKIAECSMRQGATDVVHGSFARPDPKSSILTLYRGMPFDGARSMVYADGAYERFRAEFEEQIRGSILELVGANEGDVADIRMSRWGHPLPSADAGLIAGGVVDKLRAPFRDRVFFVEQDNWALPAFETATMEAINFAPAIAKVAAQRGPA